MITVQKPELSGDLLVHFGVRGMRWGQKKVAPSDASIGRQPAASSESATRKTTSPSGSPDKPQKTIPRKKVTIGAAVAAGASIGALLLKERGRATISNISKRIETSRENARSLRAAEAVTKGETMKTVMKARVSELSPASRNSQLPPVVKNSKLARAFQKAQLTPALKKA